MNRDARATASTSADARFNQSSAEMQATASTSTDARFNQSSAEMQATASTSTDARFNQSSAEMQATASTSTDARFNQTSTEMQATSSTSADAKFKQASAKMQAAVQQHMPDYESSSDEDEIQSSSIIESIFVNFGRDSGKAYLGRTREFLEQLFQSGGITCAVCLVSIKRAQPIWNCSSCHSAFHLPCIQRWSKQSINIQVASPVVGDIPVIDRSFRLPQWSCPKCRATYNQDEIPRYYECFCNKKRDPEFHAWVIPHSCGDICGKLLQPNCGHSCLLLCHPGPCPPCPKMVQAKCGCGKSNAVPRRCTQSEWTCNEECRRLLDCDQHHCKKGCHSGSCPPCDKTKSQACICQAQTMLVPCNQTQWQCDKVCNKELSCGYHRCVRVCHIDECGPCLGGGEQSCPCGSTRAILECPEEIPPCANTCNKLLPCFMHRCPHKCHKNACPLCLQLVEKNCRCGAHIRSSACGRPVPLCDSKCRAMRVCGQHPCNRRCCDGACPPCDRFCGRMLSCARHRCTAPCHCGPCYPCPLTSDVHCRCQATKITVMCGMQRKYRPPKCTKICRVASLCHHGEENKHTCHFGACPDCAKVCGKTMVCGHKCNTLCHAAVLTITSNFKVDTPYDLQQAVPSSHFEECEDLAPRPCPLPVPPIYLFHHLPCPPTAPCFYLLPKTTFEYERIFIIWPMNNLENPTLCAMLPCENLVEYIKKPCPPCIEPVTVWCMGKHCGRNIPCSQVAPFSCDTFCGQPLLCGNHKCKKPCHVVLTPETEGTSDSVACDTCSGQCTLERQPGCIHPCTKQCHPPPCVSCSQYLKKRCHCGLVEVFIKCELYNGSDETAKNETLSCKQQCIKLLKCGHRCTSICHTGDCSSVDKCDKKVKFYCNCRRIKKDVPCNKSKDFSVDCNNVCEEIKKKQELLQKEEADRLQKETEEQNLKELEKFERKYQKKKRVLKTSDVTKPSTSKYMYLGISLSVIVVISAYVLYVYLINTME